MRLYLFDLFCRLFVTVEDFLVGVLFREGVRESEESLLYRLKKNFYNPESIR